MENYPTSKNTNYGEKPTLVTLPNEVLYLILNRLLPSDLVSCYNTCEKLRKVLSNMTLLQNKWIAWCFGTATMMLVSAPLFWQQ